MTGDRFDVGEQVTILPPWDNDDYIVRFQHYGRVASRDQDEYMVELDNAAPVRNQAPQPGRLQVGPFPAERLARGWRDNRGRWR
jgi:hypothetical protein